jgi:uncharacterized protein
VDGNGSPTASDRKALPDDDPFLTDCDVYAASETDGQRKGDGVPFEKLTPARAIPACLEVLKDYPNSLRSQYQLGRAYERNGEYDNARVWYRKAADRGYVEAERRLEKLKTLN